MYDDDVTVPAPPPPAPVRVWTLTKVGHTVTCSAQPHPLGVELVTEMDGEVVWTEVPRTAHAGQALADSWWQAFIGKGWRDGARPGAPAPSDRTP